MGSFKVNGFESECEESDDIRFEMEDLEQEQLKKPKLNAKSAEWFEEIQQQDYIRSITVTPQHQFHLIKFTLSNSHFVFHFHFSFKNIYYLFTFFDFFCFISG